MARIAVTRRLPGDAVGRLTAAGHDVVVHPGDLPPTPQALRELAAGAEGLLCTLADRIDAPFLASSPSLRAIAVYAVGTDNVDFSATQARGINVGNTPDVLTDATADLAMALLLAAARQLPAAEQNVRNGRWTTWEPSGFLGLELRGARLLVVGGGRIGRAVGERAAAFGMTVTFLGRDGDLRSALPAADVVSLHAPLTPATRGLIGRDELALLPRGAILVNTARGELVDQTALAGALHAGQLRAAALDVTTPEPLPADDPLLAAPNLIVVPHIGSATTAARTAMADRAVANLLAGLAGEPMPWPAGQR